MGGDESNTSGSNGNVSPGVPADKWECGAADYDIELLTEIAAAAAFDAAAWTADPDEG